MVFAVMEGNSSLLIIYVSSKTSEALRKHHSKANDNAQHKQQKQHAAIKGCSEVNLKHGERRRKPLREPRGAVDARGPSEGDGIDLSSDSGSINKQQASGFKAEETHLYFSRRVRIWIPELWTCPRTDGGTTFFPRLTRSGRSGCFARAKPSDNFLTVGYIKVLS
ncbi:hypothetical protein EYF80_037536 [Liparis tanakae]|uniref:Uncharacterized protein n=1 Tax=Liparis tanakae TaxID=230148 RepID=A0A4Z2GG46_9TELE|nr:hypothetical protein EYF80_037536 [Liparis tanakae]